MSLQTAEKKAVPKLRFPDFAGEWKKRRLAELTNLLRSGIGITSASISSLQTPESYPVYGGNGLRGFANSLTHEGEFVLIGRQGALCGNIRRVSGQCYISEHAIAASTNQDNDINWLEQILIKLNLNRLSESSAQPGLSVQKLSRLRINTPSLPEQKKIADFLGAVDDKIAKLTEKKALSERYKKGMMQKLFSQSLRFKDENGQDYPDWEERRLGEIASFQGGGTPSKEVSSYWSGDIPWVSSSDILEGQTAAPSISRYITETAIRESATKIVPKASVLIVSRVGVGKIAVADRDLCTSQDFCNLVLHEGIPQFIAKSLLFNRRKIMALVQGTSIGGVTSDDLRQFKLFFPAINEQRKIADFLSAIDAKINHVSNELEQAKLFKKGLLQQMFV